MSSRRVPAQRSEGPVPQVPLERGATGGLRPTGPGWFVVTLADAEWQGIPGHAYVAPEGARRSWRQYGLGVDVLEPGASNAPYHREHHEDESFLVLDGAVDAVLEGQQHRLGPGDFVHCPAGTAHAFVGAGEAPAVIFMLGARNAVPDGAEWGEYVADVRAGALGASVEQTTPDSEVAYAGRPEYAQVAPPGAADWPDRITTGVVEDAKRARVRSKGIGSARIKKGDAGGLRRVSAGWTLINLRDHEWFDNGRTMRCFLGDDEGFAQYGVNVQVLRPGQPNCRYHREYRADETMLVLAGKAVFVVEGEERLVRAGDVAHCPAGTAHVFVGAGDEPCAILMVGARGVDPPGEQWGVYEPDPAAAKHGAAVERTTHDADEAYADRPPFVLTRASWGIG